MRYLLFCLVVLLPSWSFAQSTYVNGLLTLPVVRVGEKFYSASLRLTDSSKLTFTLDMDKLIPVTGQLHKPNIDPYFSYEKNQLVIPDLNVAGVRYGVAMDLLYLDSRQGGLFKVNLASTRPIPELTILFAYTPAAKAAMPDIEAAIALEIDRLNRAFANSGIVAVAKVAGTTEVQFLESESLYALSEARDEKADFARVAQLRKSLKADLLSVWAAYGKHYSYGSVPNNYVSLEYTSDLGNYIPSEQDAKAGIFQIDVLPYINTTFVHEAGHVLGILHDRISQNEVPGSGNFNFGYSDPAGGFADVMSYNVECVAVNANCAQLNFFSNPDVLLLGRRGGIPKGEALAADGASQVRRLLPFISRYGEGLANKLTGPALAVRSTGSGGGRVSVVGVSDAVQISDSLPSMSIQAQAGTAPVITLRALPSPGSSFTGWNGGCAGMSDCVVTLSQSSTVFAGFENLQKSLTVQKTGSGRVTTPGTRQIDCGAICEASVTSTPIHLTATADPGWAFAGWGGACTGAELNCVVTLVSSQTVSARFVPQRNVTVEVRLNGQGQVDGKRIGVENYELLCSAVERVCRMTVPVGQKFKLDASPPRNGKFVGWDGIPASGCPTRSTSDGLWAPLFSHNYRYCEFIVTDDLAITANFAVLTEPRTVAVKIAGTGGVSAGINGSCPTSSAPCNITLEGGTVAVFTPWRFLSAYRSSSFLGWTGCDAVLDDACLVHVTSSREISARFK